MPGAGLSIFPAMQVDPTQRGASEAGAAGNAIEVRGLEKAFGDVEAVRGLDLVVRPGESLGLLGPNGAGKTTTLRILSTLLKADAGRVSVLGLDPARDGAALRKLGLGEHARALTEFWPRRGPVWDGLALAGDAVVLVEAKAHVTEFLTSPSAATAPESVAQIACALRQVKADLGADDRSDWSRVFFQYANRLAFLWWLRARGIDAHCLFVSFLGDTEMGGPEHAETWEALFRAADHALGLSPRHPLRPYILHVHPDLRELEKP